jgi:oligopeptide transport system permease protein
MDTKDTNTDPTSGAIISGSPPTPLQADLEIREGEELSVTQAVQEKSKKTATPFQESLGRLRRDKRAMISLGVLIFLLLIPIFGPSIYTHIGAPLNSATNGTIGPAIYHNPYHIELVSEDQNPSAQYWLGTDSVGRDLLSRLMQGLLISITVALAVEVIDVALGITIGVLAGYFGGWIDQVLARFTDVMFAFPGLLFAILLTGIFGYQADNVFGHIPIVGANGNARLILVSIALAMTTWPLMARYVRGQTLQLKEQQFVEAARTSGASDLQIIRHHIIPNLFSIVIIAATLNISGTIIGEAGLSFLGLGVQTPGSSLGLMISDSLNATATHPWEVLLPSFVLTIIVLALSFLGDGLRDAFDPRSKD